jgi:hypothetical protein
MIVTEDLPANPLLEAGRDRLRNTSLNYEMTKQLLSIDLMQTMACII